MDKIDARTVINERTTIPISMLITVLPLLVPIIFLFFQVNAHSTDIKDLKSEDQEIRGELQSIKDDYTKQVEALNGKFTDFTLILAKIANKLNIPVKTSSTLETQILDPTITFDP